MIGIDRYRTLAAGRPDAAWLRFNGGLTWDADDESNAIASVFVHERNIGYDARLLEPERVAAATPGVDARAITPQGAIFNPGEGWVDLPALIGVLLEEFTALGGRAAASKGPAAVETKNGRASGVALADGKKSRPTPSFSLSAPPRRRHSRNSARAFLTRRRSRCCCAPRLFAIRCARSSTRRVAIRPEPGGGSVLNSAWSEEVRIRDDGTYAVEDDTLRRLLAEASGVLEGNPKLALAGYGVGPKPIPGDGDPVLGELDKTPRPPCRFQPQRRHPRPHRRRLARRRDPRWPPASPALAVSAGTIQRLRLHSRCGRRPL